MLLLIDGYNLLHATGIFGSAEGPPTLERSRDALLDFLVEALGEKLAARSVVVFDAVRAPRGLPREVMHRGLLVRFAMRGHTADELIEELIAEVADPRNLLVVSSDHRVQRAARQRGAAFTDSEPWYGQLSAQLRERQSSAADADHGDKRDGDKLRAPLENPFPAGYASDLMKDDLEDPFRPK